MMRFWVPLKQRAQQELIKRGRCVADAKPLADAQRNPHPKDESCELVTCTCGRVYTYNKQLNEYRRSTLDELTLLKGDL